MCTSSYMPPVLLWSEFDYHHRTPVRVLLMHGRSMLCGGRYRPVAQGWVRLCARTEQHGQRELVPAFSVSISQDVEAQTRSTWTQHTHRKLHDDKPRLFPSKRKTQLCQRDSPVWHSWYMRYAERSISSSSPGRSGSMPGTYTFLSASPAAPSSSISTPSSSSLPASSISTMSAASSANVSSSGADILAQGRSLVTSDGTTWFKHPALSLLLPSCLPPSLSLALPPSLPPSLPLPSSPTPCLSPHLREFVWPLWLLVPAAWKDQTNTYLYEKPPTLL